MLKPRTCCILPAAVCTLAACVFANGATASQVPTAPAWPVRARRSYGDAGSSFLGLRSSGKFYADRTRFLRELDDEVACVLYRPQRFGKSLWLSTMECYYDIRFADTDVPAEQDICFSKLFQGLAIAADETRDKGLQNSFHVLRIEFPKDYSVRDQHAKFNTKVNSQIDNFLRAKPEVVEASEWPLRSNFVVPNNCTETLRRVLKTVNFDLHRPLMVLVDEVDRAAVTAWAYCDEPDPDRDTARYCDAINAARDFLGELKTMVSTDDNAFGNRYFVTGIVPIALRESQFSGFTDLTFTGRLAGLLGLTEGEVKAALVHVAGVEDHSQELEQALDVARKCFNGYYFEHCEEGLYNPQLVLHYVQNYNEVFKVRIQRNDPIGDYLHRLMDPNQAVSPRLVRTMRDSEAAPLLLLSRQGARVVADDGIAFIVEARELSERPLSYMFFTGALTFSPDTAAQRTNEVALCFPNAVTEIAVVDRYRRLVLGGHGSPSRFFREPTETNLQVLLSRILSKIDLAASPPTLERWLQCVFAAELIVSLKPLGSKVVKGVIVEDSPTPSSSRRLDIKLVTCKDEIFVELKLVSLEALNEASQAIALGRWLSKQQLGRLQCAQSGTYVRTVHQHAISQVTKDLRTARLSARWRGKSTENLFGFAVTHVAEHFLVEKQSL